MFIEDAVTFSVVVWLLFLLECVHRVPQGRVAFGASIGGRYTGRIPPVLVAGSGWTLVNPLSLGKGVFIAATDDLGFDLRAARARYGQFLKGSRTVARVARFAALFSLAGFPLCVLFLGPVTGLAILVAVSVIASGVAVRWARGQDLGERVDRIGTLVKIAIYPLGPLFAVELASSRCFAGIHPVTTGLALAAKNSLNIAERLWRESAHPATGDDLARSAITRKGIESLMSNSVLTAWKRPPAVANGLASGFCPRCLQQFVKADVCSDCPGVAIVAYERRASWTRGLLR